jgi:hypothetical protein
LHSGNQVSAFDLYSLLNTGFPDRSEAKWRDLDGYTRSLQLATRATPAPEPSVALGKSGISVH